MKVDNIQLYDYIVEKGLLPVDQVKPFFAQAQADNTQLGDILLQAQVISDVRLVQSKAEMLGHPYVDLSKEKILDKTLQLIPEQLAKKAHVIAFKKKGDTLNVAMTNPDDLQTLDFLRKKTGLIIVPHAITSAALSDIIKQYEQTLKAEFGDIIKDDESGGVMSKEESAKMADELPIVRIVETLIKHAILQGASDIHIEPLEKEVEVRYRIDGILRQAMVLPKNTFQGIIARIKVLSNLKLDEHRLPQDGRFKMETDEYKISFRVSILPVFDGEKVVMRLLDESSQGLTLEKMGLFGESLAVINREISKPNGMILVTGPTGSGKTTTLYTIVDILNSPKVNISTIEDPVEYRMDHINQTQVHAKIGMTFGAGLRSLLRQDPDIIMVGEIRDKETLEIAIHAAMTGHLLLSTLHTNSAAGAIPRMVDMGAEPFLIASTTNVIIAQRLVRKLCGECRESYTFDAKEIDTLSKNYELEEIMSVLIKLKIVVAGTAWTDITFYKPVGCGQCGGTGYKGRNGIFEVLEISDEIEELITQNATADVIQGKACEDGMITMIDDGFYKAIQGITSIEEVMRVTRE